MIDVHTPPNTIQRIETIWAYVSIDETGEGLCGAKIAPGLWTSLTTCDEKMLPLLRKAARQVSNLTGKKLLLLKFTGREVIEDITPQGAGYGNG